MFAVFLAYLIPFFACCGSRDPVTFAPEAHAIIMMAEQSGDFNHPSLGDAVALSVAVQDGSLSKRNTATILSDFFVFI